MGLEQDGPTRRSFLARLRSEIDKRGTIEVLRHGLKHRAHDLDLFYGTPSAENERAQWLFEQNRFTVTRQLRYSQQSEQALDLGLFINGLPIATFELKNSLTKQTVDDAKRQYKHDRNPREKLFGFGRCLAHFAVDESEVYFTTQLKGKATWFLPFNKGWNDGAGNPPNPEGLKTDYLWREVLERKSLTDIVENYAQLVESKDERTGRKQREQIWPRYHQLEVVRRLLASAREHGAGRRYLIQHSAGSGKSNSIAWLAHQLIRLTKGETKARARGKRGKREGAGGDPVFDSIIVVTDRRILDRQIHGTIRQYAQVGATVGHAERSGDLRRFIESGKKIIISTVQKFPLILDEIGDEQRRRNFAIIIDEAHSSQGGKTSAAMSQALSEAGAKGGQGEGNGELGEGEEESYEDQINRLMESRKLLRNASYFAFTATPKNKTLEIFGDPERQPDGSVKHHAFHSYTMKQAIDEGFILDVLGHYTPVASYYRLSKRVEEDPKFDVKKAQQKLRRYVEGHEYAIHLKAEIMVDHFLDQVLAQNKIGGEARAMVVTNGVRRAIQYFHALRSYLKERKSRYQAIVAFSGEHRFGGVKVSEGSLNGFPASKIAEKIREDPYRFLVCADKFQTGYDEPLLHTMHVDKTLSGIKAVQTLSRLNRAHPEKHDTFVLDFLNDSETIRDSFADFYRTTILSDETDPDKLHDLQADLDRFQVYSPEQVDDFVERFLKGLERDQLDPILDACVDSYLNLDEAEQVELKGKAKSFVRTYRFLSSLLPYSNADWEKRSIFLSFLVSKLPAPKEKDLSKGILEAIDMESYRVEKRAMQRIILADEAAEIGPLPTGEGGHPPEPELDRLSNIIRAFNEQFGDISWEDRDRVQQLITKTIPARVAEDPAFRNARQNSDKENTRIEHDRALQRVMVALMKDDTELFKRFTDDEGFKRWLTDTVFGIAYEQAGLR
ncbi:MAG: type I restriction endonuclease [Truepera sp.]|nr:type I restriction endonuclease [Truepera sp.]